MKPVRTILLTSVVVVAVGVACGGSTNNGSSGTSGTASGASGATTGTTGTGSGASTGTSTGTTGTSGTSGTAGTSSGVTDAGMIVNNNIACPPTSTTLSCATSQFCCRTAGTAMMGMMGGGASTYACVASASACSGTGQTVTQCTSAAQCGSQVCCSEPLAATGDAAGGGFNVATNDVCETTCPTGSTQLCSGTGTGECANGGTCANGRCQPPPCTSTSCTSPEICCSGFGNPACAMPSMTGACPNGAKVCASNSDCGTDESCNAPAMGTGAMTCAAKTCTAKSDCTSPDLCCAGFGGGATCGAPTTAGACPNGGNAVCASDSDCTSPDTCQPTTVGGFGGMEASAGPNTCQAPTCTAASATNAMPCASGMVCCAGFGGGTARCATPSMTGGCTGGGAPVCLVDSDCTGGLVCRSAGGMNGALGCRTPLDAGTTTPPPPVDSGAGD